MSPQLSIVIPTHNRPDILRQCLEHLELQTVAADIEAVVIHDGENDKETTLVANSDWQIPIYYEAISKSQQGVARNRGVAKAQASTVLFIGDDIFLDSKACEVHLTAHEHIGTPAAVLGFTTWDPSLEVTPLMRWLETSGWQFGYPKIDSYVHNTLPPAIQHLFSYTSHISLPTAVAKRTPFREDVTLYGWEDMEWGLRLTAQGVPVYYEPWATAKHHHALTEQESLKRMETLGRSVVTVSQLNPAMDRQPTGLKLLAYKLLAMLPTMAGKHRRAFLKGIKHDELRIKTKNNS